MTTRGRKPHYLTIERFEQFLNNDFWHLKMQIRILFYIGITILAAVVAGIVVGVFA